MICLSGSKHSLSDYIFNDGLAPTVGRCSNKNSDSDMFLRSENQSSSRCVSVCLMCVLPEMQGKCSCGRSHPCHFSILKGLSHLFLQPDLADKSRPQLQGDILGNSRKAWSLVDPVADTHL